MVFDPGLWCTFADKNNYKRQFEVHMYSVAKLSSFPVPVYFYFQLQLQLQLQLYFY